MRKKNSTLYTLHSTLNTWLWRAPAKFAALLMGIVIIAGLIFAGAGYAFNISVFAMQNAFLAVMAAATVYSIYKLIKWLPSDKLNRAGFVSIDNGFGFVHYFILLATVAIGLSNPQLMTYYSVMLANKSMALLSIAVFIIAIGYLYMVGLSIANLYATYLRARAIGVPKWKAILSVPCTLMVLWMPAYMLPENKPTANSVPSKYKWFNAITNWVVAHPRNSVIAFLVMLILSYWTVDESIVLITGLFGIIFGVWVWIVGIKKFRDNIGGAYSTYAAALNIAVVVSILGLFVTAAFIPHKTVSVESIEIIENPK
jgi:hypothetical protein